ncbi:MAG: SDR family oxidoreductase [Candidatus Omnitrophica bacterium]|nr:SDR family oxidoreductase [Candidatus Omnitrophota bacterium]
MEINLENKVGIVTGGALGIGREIVSNFYRNKMKVVIADINEKLGNELVDEIKKLFIGEAYFIETDVSNKKSVEDMVKTTIEKFKKIDVLVNNAGINIPRLLVDPKGKEEVTEGVFDKIVAINQKGAYLCAQAVAKEMIKAKSGVIINMSSESGLEGSEGQSIYAGTKAALYSYTRSWAKELGKFNIRVVGVAPGILEPTALRSPEYERALAYTRGITVEQLKAGYEKSSIPIGRTGKLNEVAELVCFLASDFAGYITGTTINIAGGKTRG